MSDSTPQDGDRSGDGSPSDSESEPASAQGFWRRAVIFLVPSRSYAAWLGTMVISAVVLALVPLFNLVGYESAAYYGVFWGLGSLFLSLHAFKRGLAEPPLAEEGAPESFGRLTARHVAYLAVPLVVLSLNALRVKNCDFTAGLAFWGLIPLVSVLIGQAVAWAVAAIWPGREWWQLGGALVAVLFSAVTFGLHLAWQPPIVGHQWFLGYFSGSIYDEALSVPTSLIAYRGMGLLAVGLVLAVVEVVRRRRTGRAIRWAVAAAVIPGAALAGLWWHRQDLGIDIDRDYIVQTELTGRLETEHFIIHYPEQRRFLQTVERLGDDHEFRYREMEEFFGTDPAADGKIRSFVYPNREVKGRLMGGRRTLVAKIWLGEMHILWPRYGHHWLAHELAHLFTAPFAGGPLDLSMQNGVGINMGLVEGIATAADWPVENMTLHEASAALRRLEMAPDIRNLLGAGGFWTQSSGRAYTLMGSFIRFLIEREGIDPFKKAYAHGDFEGAYGESVDALVSRWEAYLGELELDESTMEVARYLYRRPSIFQKVCARTTAELRRRARIAASRGDVARARELYDRLIGFAPRNTNYRIEFANQLLVAGDVDGARQMVDRLLSENLPPVQKARLLQLRGDALWHEERPQSAADSYQKCLSTGLPWGLRRLVRAKHESVGRERPEIRQLAFDYFLGRHSSTVNLYFPLEWARRAQPDALAEYLVGRRMWGARQWEAAERHLKAAVRGLKRPELGLEARRLLGRTNVALGDLTGARAVFEKLAEQPRSKYAAEAREWLERIEWRRNTGASK